MLNGAIWWANKKEEVYEVDHLEIIPPDLKGSSEFFGGFDSGYTTIYDLNKKTPLKVNNKPEYWNDNTKEELYSRITRLWDETYFKEYRV